MAAQNLPFELELIPGVIMKFRIGEVLTDKFALVNNRDRVVWIKKLPNANVSPNDLVKRIVAVASTEITHDGVRVYAPQLIGKPAEEVNLILDECSQLAHFWFSAWLVLTSGVDTSDWDTYYSKLAYILRLRDFDDIYDGLKLYANDEIE